MLSCDTNPRFLLFLLALSSCTLGPVTPTQQLARLEELKPDGFGRKTAGFYFELITNVQYADPVVQIADEIYRGVMADTKMSESERVFSLYPVYFYADRQEYLKKSQMPEWSDAVFRQGMILTYKHDDPLRTKEVLAHEITHLIFWEFFGVPGMDLLWLNEGLAMHEDSKFNKNKSLTHLGLLAQRLKTNYIPLAKLTAVKSAREHKPDEAKAFYIESWFLVKYLLEAGGNVGFYEMLKALKNGCGLNQAIAAGFPGKWRSLAELEASFKNEFQIK